MNELISLINDYLLSVEYGMSLFEKSTGRRDILSAWHKGDLPKTGDLSSEVSYELHGIGCCFIFSDYEVDFDFGPSARTDGFDLWRLRQYSKQFPTRYPSLQNEASLKAAFSTLESDGHISQRFPTQSSLFFLRSASL